MKILKLFLEMEAGTAGFNAPLKRARQNLAGFGKTANNMGGVLGKLKSRIQFLTAAVLVLGTASKLLRSAFQKMQVIEVLTARMKTATGSTESARLAFSQLSELSKDMPGSIEDLTDAFIRLKNFGLDAGNAALISYSNTSVAMGKNLKQLTEAVADAVTLEFERLKEFGILSRNQGDEIAFTFRGITTVVENSSEAIQGYLKDIGDTTFAGAVEDQMDTLSAKITKLSDAWLRFVVAIGGPATGVTKAGLSFLTESLDEMAAKAEAAAFKMDAAFKIGDIPLLERQIARLTMELDALADTTEVNAAGMQELARMGVDIDNVDWRTIARGREADLAKLNARLLELQKEHMHNENLATKAALKARIADGEAALSAHSAVIHKEWLSRNKPLEAQALILADIDQLTEKILAGDAGNPIAAADRVLKMRQEVVKLQESIEKTNESTKKFMDNLTEGLARGIVLGDNLRDVLAHVVQQFAIARVTGFLQGLIPGPKASGAGKLSVGAEDVVQVGSGITRGPLENFPNLSPSSLQSSVNGPVRREIVQNIHFDIRGSDLDNQRQIAAAVDTSVQLAISENQNLKNRGVIK